MVAPAHRRRTALTQPTCHPQSGFNAVYLSVVLEVCFGKRQCSQTVIASTFLIVPVFQHIDEFNLI